MRSELQQRVLETIRRFRMVQPGDRLGAAVSGGADSVALLLLLEELKHELGVVLLIVHFNHQLRGPSAQADAQFVAALAASRHLEFISASEDVAALARRTRANLEEAARRCRYQFFSNVVEARKADVIATGHTADDQAETVLGRLLRGTGPLGLAGIYPIFGRVVRPLLEVRRQSLREYLIARGQSWCEDQTNRDTDRLRARIRQRLLPPLEREFSSNIVAHLGRLADLARVDELFWNALLEERLRALVTSEPEGLSIRRASLLRPLALDGITASMPDSEAQHALTLRLIRRILEELKGDRRRLTAGHVAQVVHLAKESTTGTQVQLPHGLVVEKRFDRIFFRLSDPARVRQAVETDQGATSYSYRVELPRAGASVIDVAETGKRVWLKLIDWPRSERDTRDAGNVLDAELLRPPLVLRNWQPGDAYRPRGRRHDRTLKRLLEGEHVSAQDRVGWPVLTSAGQLAWVRGLPPAAEFAATTGTRTGLMITEEPQ